MPLTVMKIMSKDPISGDTIYTSRPDMCIIMMFIMQKMVKSPRQNKHRKHSLENVYRAMKKFLRNNIAMRATLHKYHQKRYSAFFSRQR